MIQRIQTVYLTLALILIGLTGWLPLGEFASETVVYELSMKGVVNLSNGQIIFNGWPLMILFSIICLLQMFIISGYKKRIRQMRLAAYNLILMLGFVGVSYFFASRSMKNIGDCVFAFKIALSFPIVAAVLNYLAIRAIGKDEALVRSIDRIR